MDLKKLAYAASTITQLIKNNRNADPKLVRNIIVAALVQDFTTDEIIELITTTGSELGIEFQDVDDLISIWQRTGLEVVTDVEHNTLWQSIANGLYYVAIVLKGLLPPPWKDITTAVLEAYDTVKEGKSNG